MKRYDDIPGTWYTDMYFFETAFYTSYNLRRLWLIHVYTGTLLLRQIGYDYPVSTLRHL